MKYLLFIALAVYPSFIFAMNDKDIVNHAELLSLRIEPASVENILKEPFYLKLVPGKGFDLSMLDLSAFSEALIFFTFHPEEKNVIGKTCFMLEAKDYEDPVIKGDKIILPQIGKKIIQMLVLYYEENPKAFEGISKIEMHVNLKNIFKEQPFAPKDVSYYTNDFFLSKDFAKKIITDFLQEKAIPAKE